MLLVGFVAACNVSTSHNFTVTGKNFSFTMPDAVPSGIDKITFKNSGTEPHEMQLFRLKPHKTYAQFKKAVSINPPSVAAILTTADAVGGAASIAPGRTQVVKTNLTPGTYVSICFDQGPDHVPHFLKGMIRQFVVYPKGGGSWGRSSGTVNLKDFSITLPAHFSGHGTYKVHNNGPSVHEFAIGRLLPGKTVADFKASLSPTYTGQPVTVDVGGFAAQNPGYTGQVTLNLPPGSYVAACFVPESNGAPHAALGMYVGFKVS